MDIVGYLWISLDIIGYPNGGNSQMTTSFGDLVADLVTWAKAKYTTSPAGQQ
jgi:hypothetical protein